MSQSSFKKSCRVFYFGSIFENSENKCIEMLYGFAQEHNSWKPNYDPKQKNQSPTWEAELPDWRST